MSAAYRVIADPRAVGGYHLRGDNYKLIACRDHQVILSGVADSGKTVSACIKAHLFCTRYPGCQGAIVRKTYTSMPGSVLQTFARISKGAAVASGGNYPLRFDYPNGSTIWVGGMDNPDKVLSSERDFIYVNQTEELSLADWETLSSRCTGRNSITTYPQLFGDCNPAGTKHWIREKGATRALTLLVSKHTDNPTIYNDDGSVTESGKVRLEALANLTGVRRKRLFEGLWQSAEGAVYDTFDSTPGGKHVHERPASEFKRWFLAMDEGYTNPAVILLVGEDSDGRRHVAREYYQRGVLQSAVCQQALAWQRERGTEACIVDDSAAGLIAELRSVGVYARAASKGRVLDGIQLVQDALKVQGDGKARLTVDPQCENLISEFESYRWKATNGIAKDEPTKENDHALDGLRYLMSSLQNNEHFAVIV